MFQCRLVQHKQIITLIAILIIRAKKNYCQPSTAEDECTPDKTSTNKLSTELFNKAGYIDTNNQFNFCSFIKDDGTFEAVALGPGNCKLRVDASGGKVDKTGCN